MNNLSVKPIQLDIHKNVCISFREDSFIVSFGDAKKFYEDDNSGAEKYIEWLKNKISQDPSTVVHIWQDNLIIGQMELGLLNNDPTCGYVNLYYLIPSKRGQGIGSFLDNYATESFRNKQLQKARLSVSPQNKPAIDFYKKMGWKDLGPRQDAPEVHFMEKILIP
jgi:ribosomal protein S18 acetylase RimI-like enzyme